jgi:dTDP-glucose 4,6-dehydratase
VADHLHSSSKPGFARALVAGGAGFLGSHLCDALLAAGTEVVCLDDFSTADPDTISYLRDHPGFSLIRRDVAEPLDLPSPVDLVLHFASPASPPHYVKMPVHTLRAGSHGTHNLLTLARRHRARFVLASTSEVYGEPLRHPQSEDYRGNVNPTGPRSMYDEAKRFAEAITCAFGRSEGVNTGIIRIFNTYGPRLRPHDGRAVPTFIRQALTGQPLTITGTGRQTRSLCYVDDLIDGVLAFAAGDQPGPINLGNPHEVTVLQLATLIRDLTGSTSPLHFTDAAPDDPTRRCPDIRLANQTLGWAPRVDLDEGLRRTIAWFTPRVHLGPSGDPDCADFRSLAH